MYSHAISGNVTTALPARLIAPMASASDTTMPMTARGVVPSASMTANSRRRSKVAISIVLAMPKAATVKTMTMMIQ